MIISVLKAFDLLVEGFLWEETSSTRILHQVSILSKIEIYGAQRVGPFDARQLASATSCASLPVRVMNWDVAVAL